MPRVHHIVTERTITDSTTSSRVWSFIGGIVEYALMVVELLLTFRFLFFLFGASSSNTFVGFIYNLTNPLVAPFQGVFANAQPGLIFFDWPTLLAMVVYGVLAYLLVWLIQFVAEDYTVDETLD